MDINILKPDFFQEFFGVEIKTNAKKNGFCSENKIKKINAFIHTYTHEKNKNQDSSRIIKLCMHAFVCCVFIAFTLLKLRKQMWFYLQIHPLHFFSL